VSRTRWFLLAGFGVGSVACSLVFPVPDVAVKSPAGEGGTASEVDAAPITEAGVAPVVDAGTLVCTQTGRGTLLVPAGDRLCIEATPVTRDEYGAFLDAAVPLSPQLSGCEDNTSWGPLGSLDGGTIMVDGVDWCDAWGYCAWAGKTLCGGFPGAMDDGGLQPDGTLSHGLPLTEAYERDASAMAWACEGGDAALTYPYGNDFQMDQCFQASFTGPPYPGPVGSMGCVGGFPGIVDLVGMFQWVDSCTEDSCGALGYQECRYFAPFDRHLDPASYGFNTPLIGFRCCGLEAPQR
jgi:hypothetical protein